jgi:hypothetical protein
MMSRPVHSCSNEEMTLWGFEAKSISPSPDLDLGKSPAIGSAECGAVTAIDAELARVAEAWSNLSEPIRRAILSMVEAGAK